MTTNNRIFGNTRFGPNLSHLPGIPKYRRGVTDGVTRFFSVFPVAFPGPSQRAVMRRSASPAQTLVWAPVPKASGASPPGRQ